LLASLRDAKPACATHRGCREALNPRLHAAIPTDYKPQSAIGNLKSEIANLKSEIANLKSPIFNPSPLANNTHYATETTWVLTQP
jgi:hypothetical protein